MATDETSLPEESPVEQFTTLTAYRPPFEVMKELQASGATSVERLAEIAGLDPSVDFRGQDLRGLDWEGTEKSRYDLEGSVEGEYPEPTDEEETDTDKGIDEGQRAERLEAADSLASLFKIELPDGPEIRELIPQELDLNPSDWLIHAAVVLDNRFWDSPPTAATETASRKSEIYVQLLRCRYGLPFAGLNDANLRGADLTGADLRRADLRRADLRDANLMGANLVGANLVGAKLTGAKLGGANLVRADLRTTDLRLADLRDAKLGRVKLVRADLRRADLREANLRDADLREANLWDVNLRDVNLWGANLQGADLREANLREANLRETNLRDANLWGANLRGAEFSRHPTQLGARWGKGLPPRNLDRIIILS